MRKGMVALLAVMSALWIFGLIDQMNSKESAMRYLALSLVLVAIGVWRWQPRRKLKPRKRDWQPPHD